MEVVGVLRPFVLLLKKISTMFHKRNAAGQGRVDDGSSLKAKPT